MLQRKKKELSEIFFPTIIQNVWKMLDFVRFVKMIINAPTGSSCSQVNKNVFVTIAISAIGLARFVKNNTVKQNIL